MTGILTCLIFGIPSLGSVAFIKWSIKKYDNDNPEAWSDLKRTRIKFLVITLFAAIFSQIIFGEYLDPQIKNIIANNAATLSKEHVEF